MKNIPSVVLFLKYNFHHSILDPVAKELKKLGINFWMTGKRHIVYDMFNETGKKFPIFVIADEWSSLFRNCSEILITTGHSPANKNTTLDSKNSEMDYIYVPSSYYRDEFIRRNIIPKKEIIVTGYPASSKIFRRELSLSSVWSKNRDDSKIRILFAPTYNKDLNIMEALIKEEAESQLFNRLLSYSVAFKLHGVLPKKYPEHDQFIKDLSNKYPNVYYHEDSHDDISDAIMWSNIVIGDCSGALLLAAAGGVPIIAFDNPNRVRSEYYDSEGPEWKFRDLYSYRIEERNLINLPYLIDEFVHYDYLRKEREKVVDILFEHQRDAEKVIANNIAKLLS